VTGIGHETDFTLCDFAADLRAPTPTAAAELVTPDAADLRAGLRMLTARLQMAGLGVFNGLRADLDLLQSRLGRTSPQRRLQTERQRLDGLDLRLIRSLQGLVNLRQARLHGLGQRLEALNPRAVLGRGFAVVRTGQGEVVRSPLQLHEGAEVQVQLARGGFSGRVEKLKDDINTPGGNDA